MEKCLVTGAAGFIGSHLVESLVIQGYNVRAFVRYNSRNNWGWLDNSEYKNSFEVVTGDIRDFDSVSSAVEGCSTVFHLAALIGIPYSYISPLAYLETNIIGTYNVLQSSLKNNSENILITSTSETYGTAQYIPIDENHPLVGQSPYSASKISADQIALSYYRSFALPVKIIRPFNTYGPRQSARAIIPTTILQLLSGCRQIKLGNIVPVRDLTYVKDTIRGFHNISRCNNLIGEVTNIGMGNGISIKDLVSKIMGLLNIQVEIIKDDQRVRPIMSEVDRLVCDNTKLKSSTTWIPEYNLNSGIQETINWIKSNIHLYKPRIFNV